VSELRNPGTRDNRGERLPAALLLQQNVNCATAAQEAAVMPHIYDCDRFVRIKTNCRDLDHSRQYYAPAASLNRP